MEEHSTSSFKNNVQFDHKPHLTEVRRGKNLRCTSCHAQIVVGNHMEVTTTTCYLCHFKESDSHDVVELSECRLCHQELPDYDIEHQVKHPINNDQVIETTVFNHIDYVTEDLKDCTSCHQHVNEGRGLARQDHCLVCHNDPKLLNRFDEIGFIHDNHITEHNVTCERCHEPIKHEVTPMPEEMKQSCNSCHVSFHSGQRQMYMGVGAKGIEEPLPNPMYKAMVDCSGCHYATPGKQASNKPFTGFTKVINYDSCKLCHGEMTEDYVDVFNDYIDETKSYLATVERALKSLSTSSLNSNKDIINKIKFNLEFVRNSYGWAHNWEYSNMILDQIIEDIARIKK